MSQSDDRSQDPWTDPQTHLDTDPANNPETDLGGDPRTPADSDSEDDPAHDTGEDEGWESEGGATPDGPATDT